MKILGFREETYTGTVCEGHNCDFEYNEEQLEKYFIVAELSEKYSNQKVMIELYESYDQCYSGWTTASFGHMEVHLIDEINWDLFTKAVKDIIIDDINPYINDSDNYPDENNEVFSYSYDGNDYYYPSGGVTVNKAIFGLEDNNESEE